MDVFYFLVKVIGELLNYFTIEGKKNKFLKMKGYVCWAVE